MNARDAFVFIAGKRERVPDRFRWRRPGPHGARLGAPTSSGAAAWGALLPSAAALFVGFPLQGQPVAGGFDPLPIGGALPLNAAWGVRRDLADAVMGQQ
ncbi:hypothetical protein H0E84_12645 [Luteimonas sp. SJ-92]|uniref:Uncharacterized protein n=1 Tax=Luteimonas salinisoli TaxID=2752307 RepID=A0A853JD67_9GAMM|nr:hypothetical protein [Luteimonas salinisoli]NZA27231.1 hypothetical protein [Luteimonas salinisoli]